MWTKAEIGKVIKESRIAAGLTQKQVADALNRPQNTISAWEVGRAQPDANTLFLLFEVLGRSVDEAFGFTEGEKNPPGTAEAAPGEDRISVDESTKLLVALGLIEEGQRLSNDDLAFLGNIISLLDVWFSKGNGK